MKTIKLFCLLCCCFHLSLNAQLENNIWYFGDSGIDFSIGDPIAIIDGSLFSDEGCASVCDSVGNLLFYSNGESIWNRNHDLMLDGASIEGNSSSTQSALILPRPYSNDLYYVFTISPIGEAGGIKWSEVYMNFDNGLGGVTMNKNIPLYGGVREKLTAVKHENLNYYWLISHDPLNGDFLAWLVTESGISASPIVSHVGSTVINLVDGTRGYLKASSDGQRLACVFGDVLNTVEVFDFNNITGQVSNPTTLSNFVHRPYGVEFSPLGQFLYVSETNWNGAGSISQFDLNVGTSAQIMDSRITVSNDNRRYGALQLGFNGKIYFTMYNNSYLGVIHEPDLFGTDCMFDDIGLYLNGNLGKMGLPNFPNIGAKQGIIESENYCYGDLTFFSINTNLDYDSVHWDFGDPNSGFNNYSSSITSGHTFSESGTFVITLTTYLNNIPTIWKDVVFINDFSFEIFGNETSCVNTTEFLYGLVPNVTNYLWSTGSTSPVIAVDTTGTYSLELTLGNCGTLTDSIFVEFKPNPLLELGNDSLACNQSLVEILPEVGNSNLSFLWSTGETTSTIYVPFTDPGDYQLTITDSNGCTSSDIVAVDFSSLTLEANQLNLNCNNDSSGVAVVFPTFGVQPYEYFWSTGDTTYTINGLAAGTYTITVTEQAGCSAVRVFALTQPLELTLNIIVNDDDPNTSVPDGSVFLNPSGGTLPYVIEWDAFGELSDPVSNLSAGQYEITVTDDNDCEIIVTVEVGGIPVGIDDISFLEKIQLYPNPTSDFLFVKMPNVEEDLEFSLANALGQTLSDFFIEKNNTGFQIDVSNLETGIYFLKIKKEEKERIWKVNVIK